MKRIALQIMAIALGMGISSVALAGFNPEVKAEQGKLLGTLDSKNSVVSWYGIPYAQQAEGKLRFAAPKPISKHKGVMDCSQFAPVNLQFNGKEVIGKEGVLTVDVCRPDTEEKNLPIMVFFHAGNNQTQSSHFMLGNRLANEGKMVFVGVQYRLGLFGFNNLPAVAGDEGGNFTLADQAAALDWVKANAKKFGGNPKNITIAGFSAGGRDVMAMLISPEFKHKFHKAISLSGGLTTAEPEASSRIIAKALAPLVVEDGKAANEEEAIAWLLSTKKKDLKEVKDYLKGLEPQRTTKLMAGALLHMSVFPHLFTDGKMLPKKGFDTKHFNDVPLLMMGSSDEFSLYTGKDPYFRDRMAEVGKVDSTTKAFRFAKKYGSLFYGYFNGQEGAERLAPHYKSDMYVCCFNFGHGPELVGEDYSLRFGAMHGSFMPFVSEQNAPAPIPEAALNTAGAKELSKAFISALSAFVHTGNPNTPLLGNTWQKWNPQYKPEMVFDANRNNARIFSINSRVSYEGIKAEMENDTTLVDEETKWYIITHVLNGRWFSKGIDEAYINK